MDKNYLQQVANYNVRQWWIRIRSVYPQLSPIVPTVKLNNRLKTTAGRAFYDCAPQYIDLSLELFWEYTEQFVMDTIPHELAHLAAWTIYQDPGHGTGWKTVLERVGIETSRLHHMVNSAHAKRKARL